MSNEVKKIIFFDVETSELPKDYKAPITMVDNWPRVIQIGILVYVLDSEGFPHCVDNYERLIKPDGWKVPNEKFWIDNGFTQEKLESEGVPILDALEYFIEWVNDSDYLVAHNISFDQKVLGAEMVRAGLKAERQLKKFCTMQLGTDWCAIPHANGKGLKWPKLEELHISLFGMGFDGAHDAMNDVEATAKCFWEMIKRGLIYLK